MIGRCLRAHPTKDEAVIIDMFGNLERHGYIENYEWDIHKESRTITTKDKPISKKDYNAAQRVHHLCDCGHVFDIKKFCECPICKKAHKVQVMDQVKNLVAEFGIENKKKFDDVINKFNIIKNCNIHEKDVRDFCIKYLKKNYSIDFFDDKYSFFKNLDKNSWEKKISI